MAFTTWAALRTAIKDAIADYVAGAPCVGEYEINGRQLKYRSIKELKELYKLTTDLEDLENGGDQTTRQSHGRYRRPL